MTNYKECEKMEQIGIDAAGFRNPEVLKDSKINSIMIYNAKSKQEAQAVINTMQQYLNLYSYGMTGDFLK